jgi:ketosteroid isomerase-like protein
VVADDNAAAVDVVGQYVDADGTTSVVSSCDVYELRDGMVTAITSYAVELDPATQG